MPNYFQEMNKMWEKTLEEHTIWLEQSRNRSLLELFNDLLKVKARIASFEEKTKHMTDENSLNEISLLAAKYKNRWIANRFLANVLEECFIRFCETFSDKIIRTKAAKKRMQNPKYQKMLQEFINQEFVKYKKSYLTNSVV